MGLAAAAAEALADPAVVAFRLADSLEAGLAPADSLEAADPLRQDPDIAETKQRLVRGKKCWQMIGPSIVQSKSVLTLDCPTGGHPCPPEFTKDTKSSYENVPPLNEALSSIICQKKRDSRP